MQSCAVVNCIVLMSLSFLSISKTHPYDKFPNFTLGKRDLTEFQMLVSCVNGKNRTFCSYVIYSYLMYKLALDLCHSSILYVYFASFFICLFSFTIIFQQTFTCIYLHDMFGQNIFFPQIINFNL